MIAAGRLRSSTVRFHVATFEDVELPLGRFDGVFSATAFHWVDPDVSWSKAASLLRRGGLLALFGHVGGGLTELEDHFLAAWRDVLPEAEHWVSRSAETLWRGAAARSANVSELWAWLTKTKIARRPKQALPRLGSQQ